MKVRISALVHDRRIIYISSILLLFILTVIGFRISSKKSDISYQTHFSLTASKPAETKTEKSFVWNGKPTDPKYIRIPTISTQGYIQNVGIDNKNEIAVPNNIHMAAWFNQSAQVGEPGLSIIDGHVNGKANNGIFQRLDKLKIDSHFTVELGSGVVKEFVITGLYTVPTDQSVNVLFSQDGKVKSQLNLITCAGEYNDTTHEYNKRLIVYSKLIN